MSWRTIVHSAIGTRHQQQQRPCQDCGDYVTHGAIVVGAVADGAGSAKYSDIGAQVAVKTLLNTLGDQVKTGLALEGNNEDAAWALFTDAVQAVIAALETEAHIGGYELRELGCTLLGFIATPEWVAAMQIGDGFIVIKSANETPYQLLLHPNKGEFINETTFVTTKDALGQMQVCVRPAEQPFVCAATDGLESVAIRLQTWQPFPPFFQPLVDCLGLDEMEQRQTYLEQFLESDRLNARTDDDKTLLLCLYCQEEP